ncbi:hypothetical protein [Nostoc sp.]
MCVSQAHRRHRQVTEILAESAIGILSLRLCVRLRLNYELA